MLEWLRFIGEFIGGMLESLLHLIPMFARAVALIQTSMAMAPPFLGSIMALMLAVAIIMWVVNIL